MVLDRIHSHFVVSDTLLRHLWSGLFEASSGSDLIDLNAVTCVPTVESQGDLQHSVLPDMSCVALGMSFFFFESHLPYL